MNDAGRRTRVIILASTLVTGGAETVVRAIAAGLPERGIDPTVVCLRSPGEIGEQIAASGVPLLARLRERGGSAAALLRLVSLMRRDGGTALLCLDHHDAIALGMTAARWASLPGRALAVHSTGLWGRRGSFSRSDRAFLGGFKKIIAVAGTHRDYLVGEEGLPADRVVVIHNGVDPERFRPPSREERLGARRALGIPEDAFAAVIVAALRPEKNHAMLIRAAARLKRSDPRFVLLIAGEGREGEALRRLARSLDLGEAVRFLGRREEIPEVLAAADLSVLCSHPVVETFPLSILESMACALPVVATSVGSVPEMIEDGVHGVLVPDGDEDALTAAVEGLGRDSRRRAGLGESARSRVMERFSQEGMIDSYASLLRGLVPSKGESSGNAG
jgi:glycosyltransferase involved in cell wall biosynthesis